MQGYDVKCSGTVKMLIDMELLAHTDYLVASDRSRWSKILQYMRYILYGALSDNCKLTEDALVVLSGTIPRCASGEQIL